LIDMTQEEEEHVRFEKEPMLSVEGERIDGRARGLFGTTSGGINSVNALKHIDCQTASHDHNFYGNTLLPTSNPALGLIPAELTALELKEPIYKKLSIVPHLSPHLISARASSVPQTQLRVTEAEGD
jgi:hypothetical protein